MRKLLTLIFILSNTVSFSQTKTWDGGAGTKNWEDANNWNPNGVPTIINDVEIDNDSVSINANQTVKSILLESTHATETNQAIFLQNGSTLSIFNSTGNGLELEDEARFWNAGSLIVVNATLQGIRVSSGVFENMANQGSISVSLSNSGITNEGTFQNRNNAQINILDVSQFGIDNYSTSSQFSNRGVITISNTQFGANNEGTFFNRGDLSIEKISDIGLVTRTYFKNFSTGNLTLDSLYSEGVFAWDDFINEGIINIKEVTNNGIEDFSGTLNLVNSGSITISKTGENGIFLGSSGSVFTNEVGGEVLIDSTIESGIYTDEKLINEGEISIHRVGRDGIEFEVGGDSLINKGLVSILNTDRYGISHEGSFFINENTGVINLDTLDATGLLISSKFINVGDININNSAVHGIYSSLTSDSLINKGSIFIENAVGAGVEHHGEIFINKSGAELAIDSTVGTGFEVYDKFINEGDISIKRTGNNGLHNYAANTDSLINNGIITIKNTVENGIVSEGLFFVNNASGEITIDSSEASGFVRQNILINEGSIEIRNSTALGFNSYINPDSLINSGQITICNSGDSGLIIGDGGPLLNTASGTITIDSSIGDGIHINSKFTNEGEVVVSNSEDEAFEFSTSKTFLNNGLIDILNAQNGLMCSGPNATNAVNGEININGIEGRGCDIGGYFVNDGSINISNSKDGLSIEESVLDNMGSINILNSEETGFNNEGVLNNAISGEIIINVTGYSGFYNEGKVNNEGSLNVYNTTEKGIEVANYSDSVINSGFISIYNSGELGVINEGEYFINTSHGEINIDNTNDAGFYNDGKFINDGSLIIKNSDESGISNLDSLLNSGQVIIKNSNNGIEHITSFFHNKSNGVVKIDSMTENGFVINNQFINEGSIQIENYGTSGLIYSSYLSDTLINNGLIEIDGSGPFDLYSLGNVFLNNDCGRIKIVGVISIGTPFLNRGLIEGPELVFQFFSDSLHNEGTLIMNRAPSSTLFKNDGNIIIPIIGTLSEAIREMNAATVGTSPSHPIPNIWWTDEAKTTAAGFYDYMDNSFTPNATGVNADTLWIELVNAGCSIIVGIAANPKPNCGPIPTYSFIGSISTDWHTAGNWNTGRVPDSCTKVVIPASQTCTITTGRKARAYRIEAETGSVFEAELGSVLDVYPDN